MLCLPEHDFDDRQTGFLGMLIDQAGDVLRRGVAVHHENSLTVLPQRGQDGVVPAQKHGVIQIVVDPLLNLPLDLREIDQHAPRVKFRALQRDHSTTIVSVQMTALAIVIQQAVAVAKINFSCDSEHFVRMALSSPPLIRTAAARLSGRNLERDRRCAIEKIRGANVRFRVE